MALRHAVGTGIRFGSLAFPLWDAAIAANATLGDLFRVDYGRPLREDEGFPVAFLAKVVAWHRLHELIELHKGDAAARAAERAAKKARRK